MITGTWRTATERNLDLKLTRDIPYLALTGDLWGVYCDKCDENGPRYNGTALYIAEINVHT